MMKFVPENFTEFQYAYSNIPIYAGLLSFNASLLQRIATRLLPNILCEI